MRKCQILFCLFFSFVGTVSLVSCSGNDDEMDEILSGTENENKIIKQLAGTCWMTNSITFYDYNNKEVSHFDTAKYPDYITFTDKKANSYNDDLVLYVDYHEYHPNYNGYTLVSHWNVSDNNLNGYLGGGNCFGEILNISKNEIKTKYIGNWENEWYRIDVYTPVNEPTHKFKPNVDNGNGNGEDNGGTIKYEKPDIGFYDFTATKTSLKVQFKIFNADKAKITSAKVYYGTSSNPSTSKNATISGVFITANISGLKAGTTYYVKCSAAGKGGTTTTTITKCITNY